MGRKYAPREEPISFEITEEGTFNAIAFWFDLELDEETTLTTNPFAEHGEKGATWQQAVQYVEELTLKPGDSLKVVAAHDTYGISFRVDDSKLEFDRGQRRTNVRSTMARGKRITSSSNASRTL